MTFGIIWLQNRMCAVKLLNAQH